MADVFQILVNIFCPTPEVASQCNSFIMDHMANFGYMEAMLYFILFPTIFILIFVFILVEFVMEKIGIKEHKKLVSFLLSVSFYIFIMISGWYPIFMRLSEVWYIVIILLVGLYIFISKFLGGGKDGGGLKGDGGRRGGGLAAALAKKAESIVTGSEDKIKNEIEGKISTMEAIVTSIEKEKSGDIGNAASRYDDLKGEVFTLMSEIEVEVAGRKIIRAGNYENKINKLDKRLREYK